MNYISFNKQKIIPSKIICIGRNFVDHIKELNNEMPKNMVIFNKPNSAISNTLRFISDDTRFEGELSLLIINKKIAGIGFGLDLTKAKIQNELKKKGLPWERAKAFDGSAVFGNFIEFDGDITQLKFELYINNNLVQTATHDLMIYKPNEIINEIESFMSLEDGDIIMTGTPKGVGTYNIGDTFISKIYYANKILIESKWDVV